MQDDNYIGNLWDRKSDKIALYVCVCVFVVSSSNSCVGMVSALQ